jgi:hypothetical protein
VRKKTKGTYQDNSAYHHCCCEFESRSGRDVQCDKVCQWLATGRWFSPGLPVVSFTNKIDRHDITEILLKVALSTNKQTKICQCYLCISTLALIKVCLKNVIPEARRIPLRVMIWAFCIDDEPHCWCNGERAGLVCGRSWLRVSVGSNQIKYYKIGIYSVSANQASCSRKSEELLLQKII